MERDCPDPSAQSEPSRRCSLQHHRDATWEYESKQIARSPGFLISEKWVSWVCRFALTMQVMCLGFMEWKLETEGLCLPKFYVETESSGWLC